MSMTVELDEDLVQQALRKTGAPTDRAAVEEALQLFLKISAQSDILDLCGKVTWEGNLDESRIGRFVD